MRRIQPQFLLLFVIALTLPILSEAQLTVDPTLERGLKPYGSFEGGAIDSISMTNGSLNLHIPLVSYPQRGAKLHFGFYLKYDTNSYVHTPSTSTECTTPPYGCVYGDSINGPLIEIVPDFDVAAYVNGTIPPAPHTPYATLKTSDGAQHEMIATSNGWRTVDATGYLCLNNCATVVEPNGIRHTTSSSQFSTKIEDPDGNFITGAVSAPINNISYTDTLGRKVAVPPSLGVGGAGFSTDFSGCTGSLPTVTAYLWSLPGYPGVKMTYKICYANVYFGAKQCVVQNKIPTCGFNDFVRPFIQSIVLPNNTAWTFQYDSDNPNNEVGATGNLLQVTFPTGGYIKYSWNAHYFCQTLSSTANTTYSYTVASRTINANDNTGDHASTYGFQDVKNLTNNPPYTTTSLDALGNQILHTLTPQASICSFYETQAQTSDSTGTIVKTVTTDYSATADPFYLGLSSTTAANVVPIRVTTKWKSGKVTKTETDYDSGVSGYLYGVPVAKREYDYGPGAPGPLLRRTATSYQAFSTSSYLSNNLLDAVSSIAVYDATGNSCKGVSTYCQYTYYGYDESALKSSAITMQHDSSPPNGSIRGDQTSIHRWLNSSAGYLSTTKVFFDTGTVNSSTDPNGNTTTFQYSSTDYGAYLTKVSNALNQSTTYAYDFNTGVLTSITDPNSQLTTKTYDIMARLTQVAYPDQGSTKYCYTDSSGTCTPAAPPFSVVITQAITSAPVQNETTTTTFDGLGRTSVAELNSDPEGSVYTQTTYDALGRRSQRYNPTRCSTITANCLSEATWGYTTTSYDALGRVTSTVEQDGSTFGTDFSTFPCTTVTDEAGNARKMCVDGLGRLTGVWEDPSGVNYETDYVYDALNNLLSVTQKGSNSGSARVRTFQYDSLSRLTSSSNPESGTITYAYDSNGNVLTKTAPAPNQTGSATVTTTYSYDALNRLTTKYYSDGTTTNGYYAYDVAPSWMSNLQNVVGRLANSNNQYGGGTSGLATATAYSYDAMGRAVEEWQQVPSLSPGGVAIMSTFDLAGNLTSTQNATASGPLFTYGPYDGANRLTKVTSSLTDANHPGTLWSADPKLGYYPEGDLEKATFGNGLTESTVYTPRLSLPPCRINLNTSGGVPVGCSGALPSGIVESYQLYWGNWGSNVNGNILAWAGSGVQNFNRSYTYDSLNRIQTMSDVAPQACQGMSWTIDAWGNMTAQTGTKGSCINFSSAVGTNNRLQSGYQYDAAGNMTYDGIHHYTYDAENRVVQVDSGSTASYVYNENGRRVRKNTGSNITEYVYGPNGLVLSEVANGSTWTVQYVYAGSKLIAEYTNNTTDFVFADHLGSTRVVTAMNQSVLDSIDYLPFGQQIAGGSTTTHKFTGKEYDAESGLNNFGARYDASVMGRFMTADWGGSPEPVPYADLDDPRTLNLYAYVRNNPLSRVDTDGHTDPPGQEAEVSCQSEPSGKCLAAHNQSVTVEEVKGQGANVFDHAAISVNGQPAVGLEPKTDTSAVVVDKTVPGAVREVDPKREVNDKANIQVTPEQAAKIQKFLDNSKQNAPNYNLYHSNCAQFCERALQAGGVKNVPNDMRPHGLVEDLKGTPHWTDYVRMVPITPFF